MSRGRSDTAMNSSPVRAAAAPATATQNSVHCSSGDGTCEVHGWGSSTPDERHPDAAGAHVGLRTTPAVGCSTRPTAGATTTPPAGATAPPLHKHDHAVRDTFRAPALGPVACAQPTAGEGRVRRRGRGPTVVAAEPPAGEVAGVGRVGRRRGGRIHRCMRRARRAFRSRRFDHPPARRPATLCRAR